MTFDIDANGILHVSAKDLGTGKEQKMTISAPQKLADDEIQRMVEDAEEHAEEDRRRREAAETRNQADSLLYATDRMLEEMAEQISEETKAAVEAKAADLRDALGGDDLAAIKAAMEALSKESQKIGEEIYRKVQEAPPATPPPEGSEEESGDVVDADYEESDEGE